MAQQRGLLYPISGRIGDKIYCVRNGVQYLRCLPTKSTQAPTEKQLIHRAKFSLITGFLFPIRSVLNEAYRRINPKKTGTKMAFNQILQHALIGKYPNFEIDYSKTNLVRGNLNPPRGTMTYVAGSNELDFSWLEANPYIDKLNDELWPLIHCSALNEFWYDLSLGIRRGDEFCTIRIPEFFIGHEIQVWLAYRSNDRRAFSDSRYMGKVLTHQIKRS
ncbi:MAG: DUF6266 family protein [Daejeonella sp.]